MCLIVRLGVLALITFAGRAGAQSGDNVASSTNITDSSIASSASVPLTQSAQVVAASTTKTSNGTCLSRTANYITHTLPQQCLRTDRVAANATRISSSSEATTSIGMISDLGSSTTIVATLIAPSETPGEDRKDDDNALPASSTLILLGSGSVETALPAPTDAVVDSSTTLSEVTEESDSPLDNAKFLSFEEWKRQNQAKAEQAAEQPFIGDRQRPVNNALDSLGDEGEIELDFSGFGNGAAAPRQQQAAYRTAEGAASAASAAAESYTPRSKDAGKTCKERTNYASFDCAATVLKSNPECKSAPSVLVENKDSYMLNICSATNKFFIVELCNDILVDTVVLANYEFFSSIFRQFRVSVSDRYPVKMDRWTDLGTFEARNTREVQAFLIEQPQIWARYLRIEFLSHYGGEYYCPVSLLRVHGTTMLEELRPEDGAATGEAAESEEGEKVEAVATPLEPQGTLSVADVVEKSAPDVGESGKLPSTVAESSIPDAETTSADSPARSEATALASSAGTVKKVVTSVQSFQNDSLTCASTSSLPQRASSSQSQGSAQASSTIADAREAVSSDQEDTFASSTTTTARRAGPSTSPDAETGSAAQRPSASSNSTHKADDQRPETSSTPPVSTGNLSSTTMEQGLKQSDAMPSISQTSTNSTRSTTTATSSVAPPQPSTQESFFKSIQKRLAQLEANSTLSLQYIEEQSRILRDAFSKVEKRQISATTVFLSNLNDTVMAELRGFRTAYDQIWQSTVIELEGQREQYQREILAMSTRLTLVAEELVWQKRMGIMQSTLVLLCLGLVLFARGGGTHHFEVPLMQNMINRSQTALSKTTTQNDWDQSPPASPSPENRSPVSVFRRKLLWRSFTEPIGAASSGADSGTDSRPGSKDGLPYPFGKHVLDVKVQPPTPERNGVMRQMRESDSSCDDDEDEEDGDIFEEVGEESAPPSPENVRLHSPPTDLLRVGVGI